MELKVMETMNYSLFSKLTGNRDENQLHIQRLVKSMKEQYLIKPIDVNDKMQIIDGQHRLAACEITGNPVYYIIHKGWGLKEAQRLNANQKNWTTEEYVKGYCDLGYKEYQSFRDFSIEYKDFSFTVLLSVAIGRNEKPCGADLAEFKNGYFKFKDRREADKKLSQLQMIKPYYSGYNTTVFAWAIFSCINNTDFMFQDFLTKLAYQSTKLVDCTNTKQYVLSIEEIYNFKRRGDRVRLF